MLIRHAFFNERLSVKLEAGATLITCTGDEIGFAKALLEYIIESNPDGAQELAEVMEQLNREGDIQ